LAESSDRQERCTGQSVRHRVEPILLDVVGAFSSPKDALQVSIVGVHENLPIHFLDVSDKDKAVPTPTQKDVGESWQKIGSDQKIVVERVSGRRALGSVEDTSQLGGRAGTPEHTVMR